MRMLALVAGVGLVTLSVTAAAAPSGSSPSPAASSGSRTSSLKIPDPASHAPLLPRPDKIESLATSPGLSKAVGPPSAGGYELEEVAHSFANLEALTMKLFAHQAALKSNGVDMVSWGPDIASNTVVVKLANYTSTAVQSLHRQYGGKSWLTVVPTHGPLPRRTFNRYYDAPYFYSGDRVWFDNNPSGAKCTSGFAFRGNNSGNTFNTTAGHCGGSSVWTNYTAHYKVGNISTNYFSSTSGWDMESFPCECAYPVWYEGPSIGTNQGRTHNIAGSCYCGVGSYITMDGASTGEVPGNKVVQVNFCTTFSDGITTCHLNYAYNPSGYTICQGGDSGGPAYQRGSNNNAYATGIIVGTDYGDDCYYHLLGAYLSKVNGSLITG